MHLPSLICHHNSKLKYTRSMWQHMHRWDKRLTWPWHCHKMFGRTCTATVRSGVGYGHIFEINWNVQVVYVGIHTETCRLLSSLFVFMSVPLAADSKRSLDSLLDDVPLQLWFCFWAGIHNHVQLADTRGMNKSSWAQLDSGESGLKSILSALLCQVCTLVPLP